MVDFKGLIPGRDKRVQTSGPREDFFDPIVTFRREIERMFDSIFGGNPLQPGAGLQAVTPAVNVDETEKDVVVTVELPGVSEKDIEVSLAGDVLTINGEKKAEQEQKSGDSYYLERRFGAFERTLRLPFEMKDEQVDAQFDNGVLIIRLSKPAELQKPARRIEVKSR